MFAQRVPAAPGIQINIPTIYPNALLPSYRIWGTQKHKSCMHDWKKWRRGTLMTILSSLGIIACSLDHYNKRPNSIVLG